MTRVFYCKNARKLVKIWYEMFKYKGARISANTVTLINQYAYARFSANTVTLI